MTPRRAIESMRSASWPVPRAVPEKCGDCFDRVAYSSFGAYVCQIQPMDDARPHRTGRSFPSMLHACIGLARKAVEEARLQFSPDLPSLNASKARSGILASTLRNFPLERG